MNKQKRQKIFEKLRQQNPNPKTELKYSSPFELLISVLLSAQATDVSVNKATDKLYPIANTPEAILELGEDGVKKYIKTIGLFNSKAKNIIKTCQILVQQHHSIVPETRSELEALPGVGRKTASVVLAEVWDVPAIAVDTHVNRVAGRLGLTDNTNPVKIETDLKALYPVEAWSGLSMRFIQYGRDTCDARRPECGKCEMFKLCEWDERFVFAGKR